MGGDIAYCIGGHPLTPSIASVSIPTPRDSLFVVILMRQLMWPFLQVSPSAFRMRHDARYLYPSFA